MFDEMESISIDETPDFPILEGKSPVYALVPELQVVVSKIGGELYLIDRRYPNRRVPVYTNVVRQQNFEDLFVDPF